MTMKDKIYAELQKGPKSDRAVADKIGAKPASVRRARGELVVDKKVQSAGRVDGEQCWKVTSAAAPTTFVVTEDKPSPAADKKDWRTNGFTF